MRTQEKTEAFAADLYARMEQAKKLIPDDSQPLDIPLKRGREYGHPVGRSHENEQNDPEQAVTIPGKPPPQSKPEQQASSSSYRGSLPPRSLEPHAPDIKVSTDSQQQPGENPHSGAVRASMGAAGQIGRSDRIEGASPGDQNQGLSTPKAYAESASFGLDVWLQRARGLHSGQSPERYASTRYIQPPVEQMTPESIPTTPLTLDMRGSWDARRSDQISITHGRTTTIHRKEYPRSALDGTVAGKYSAPLDSAVGSKLLQPTAHLSVRAANEWYESMKSGSKAAQLPDHELIRALEGRDHVFIVDDSDSMKKHWNNVIGLITLLAYITKSTDPDGMELRFLNSKKTSRYKKATAMATEVRKTVLGGVTKLENTLIPLLAEFNDRVKKGMDTGLGKSKWSLRKSPKPCNVYILTDGNWIDHETALEKVDRELIRRKTVSHRQNDLGIQFITFGEDPEGLKHVDELDGLGREGELQVSRIVERRYVLTHCSDIIDAEPADGNVWKMLLGSMSAWFDEDG